MTENEAKTKWCPMSRTVMSAHSGVNRVDAGENKRLDIATCIGSACMMWRPEFKMIYSEDIRGNERPPFTDGTIIGGHCGLAGHP